MPIASQNDRRRLGAALPAVFFAGLALLGILATLFLVDRIATLGRSADWTDVDCTILESHVVGRDGPDSLGPFRFVLRYEYAFGGQTYEGTRWRLEPVEAWDIGPVWDAARRHPPGSTAFCLVNPAAPHESVLDRDELGGVRTLLTIPVALAIAGVLGVGWSLRGSRPRSDASDNVASIAPIETHGTGIGGALFFVFVASIFFVAGAATVALFHMRPTVLAWRAHAWPTIDCRIIASGVSSDRRSGRVAGQTGPASPNYFVEVLYEYQVDGATYRSSRFQTSRLGSLSSRRAHDAVRALGASTQTTCRVDPSDPHRAILDPSPPPLIGVPAIFGVLTLGGFAGVAVGLGSIERTLRRRRPMRVVGGDDAPRWRSPLVDGAVSRIGEVTAARPRMLLNDSARVTRAMMTLLLAFGVNAFVYLDLAPRVWYGWSSAPIGMTLLALGAVVLATIGAIVAVAAVQLITGLRRPRFRLIASPDHPRVGETVRIDWECDARGHRVRRILFQLVGIERTGEHGHGCTHTEFARHAGHDAGTPTGADFGHFTVTLPVDRPTNRRKASAIEWQWQIATTSPAGDQWMEEIRFDILGPKPGDLSGPTEPPLDSTT